MKISAKEESGGSATDRLPIRYALVIDLSSEVARDFGEQGTSLLDKVKVGKYIILKY